MTQERKPLPLKKSQLLVLCSIASSKADLKTPSSVSALTLVGGVVRWRMDAGRETKPILAACAGIAQAGSMLEQLQCNFWLEGKSLVLCTPASEMFWLQL